MYHHLSSSFTIMNHHLPSISKMETNHIKSQRAVSPNCARWPWGLGDWSSFVRDPGDVLWSYEFGKCWTFFMERLDKFAFGTVTKVLMLCTTVSHPWAVPDTDFPVDQCDSCKALDRYSTCQLASMMQFPKAYCLTCFYCNLNGQENCLE